MAVVARHRRGRAVTRLPHRLVSLLAFSTVVLWRGAGLLASRHGAHTGGHQPQRQATACLIPPELDRLRSNFQLWAKARLLGSSPPWHFISLSCF